MSLGFDMFSTKSASSTSPNHGITTEPLTVSANYLSWSSSVQLWGKGQGVQDHLVTQAKDITEKDRDLYSLLWKSIDSKFMPLFRPFQTCFLVWEKARGLYTNDISCFYNVISRRLILKSWTWDMSTYVQAVMEEFNELMPVTPNVEKQLEQRQKIFLVITLAGLPSDI